MHNFLFMRSIFKFISVCVLLQLAPIQGNAQLHPMEALGREIFDSFRQADFNTFYQRSIFVLNEESFKFFLSNVRNKSLQDNLISLHKQPFPTNSSIVEKWNIAFEHLWRNELRHIARYSPTRVHRESFAPILQETKEYDIQWKTTKLLGIEVLLDKLTYSKTFMIGTEPEDSEKSFKSGILGNGSGQGDILIRFDSSTPSNLFYFCPDQRGAGGPIVIKDLEDMNKPNQRTDILLTFSFDQPARAFQIIVRDAILSHKGPIFTERPQFLGEVQLPRGLSFPN
ncbi:MAG: hypothetical protein ACKVJ1_10600 [Verrucomicrobiia bacterium]